jgi:hypothetical protein
MATDPGKDFAAGKGFGGMATEMKAAMEAGITPDTTIQILTSIEKQVNDIQKGLTDGVVVGAEKFRSRLTDVYKSTQDIGASFKDVTDLASGIGTSLGKAITPSEKTLTSMIEFGKSTGMANAEITNTIATFVKLGNSQTDSLLIMKDITLEARQSGLDAQTIIKDVSENLIKVSTLGFSNGVDGLASMATEAKSLNVSVKDIGSMKLAETLWDPKSATELAQKMQMLGGNVGNLGNSFELMRMGAYDVEGLQESMLDLFETSFKLNETTGKFEIDGGQVGRQQLKQRSAALQVDLETATKIGMERAKQSFIEDEINSKMKGQFSEDQLTLIKNLSQVGAGKKIEISLPGFESIEDLGSLNTEQMNAFKNSLKEYEAQSKLSDRRLAEMNLTVTEKSEISLQVIKETLLSQLKATDRENVLKAAGVVRETGQDLYGTATKDFIDATGMKTLVTTSADFIALLRSQVNADTPTPADKNKFETSTGTSVYSAAKDYLSTDQPFTGSKLITGDKGTIQTMIFDKDDDFLAAPKLNEILNKSKMSFDAVYALNEMSSKPLPKEMNPIGETFTKTEATINTNNTTEIKFDPLVIRIEGVDGNLKQMLEKGDNATLLTDKIREEFSKMPKFMRSKGVFGG